MAVYGQPNQWQCGPFALKHALLVQGVRTHEDELARLAGSSEQHGTDETQLAGAAERFGGRLRITRHRSVGAARQTLTASLRDAPVLLCFDQWEHWVTAVGADQDRVVLLDSHYDTVLRVEPWDSVLHRTAYVKPWRMGFAAWTLYDLHAVIVPTRRRYVRFTPKTADRLSAGGRVLTAWDEHLETLAALSDAAATRPLAAALEAARPAVVARAGENGTLDRLGELVRVAEAFELRARPLDADRLAETLFPAAGQPALARTA
jgi:hypothetical protein